MSSSNGPGISSGGLTSVIRFFTVSKVTPLLVIASVLLGYFALVQLPREEEPQIVVPMFDVFVAFPGATPEEVQKRIIDLGERKFWEISGVEYVYSTAEPNGALFIVRFRVGEDTEKSLIKLYTKVYSNLDYLPPGASTPLIKHRSIDDVPVLALTFYSKARSPQELRRIVATVRDKINPIPNVSETTLIGGRQRVFHVFFDAQKLGEHLLTPLDLVRQIQATNVRKPAGRLETVPTEIDVESDSFVTKKEDLQNLVVGVSGGRIVYLKDVATVVDGPDEGERTVLLCYGPAGPRSSSGERLEAVTLAIAKRKGSNATELSRKILSTVEALRGKVLPEDIQYLVTRDYGQTAAEKANELLFHMGLAVFGVGALIAFSLGLRAAAVVMVAIPTTMGLTLLTFQLFGFTINRVTLFALIFTIGILVDDPIVGVENIVRHLHLPENHNKDVLAIAAEAVNEIVSPLILATLAVIAAILPMASVGGLMGPYMRPIPIGASAAMIFSLVVSLSITPWAAARFLGRKKDYGEDRGEDLLTRIYRAYMGPLIYSRFWRIVFFVLVLLLLAGSVSLIFFRLVRVKMLPFDNKNEFQVVLNMPEGTSLEVTEQALLRITEILKKIPEAKDMEIYVGCSAPYSFNGLVRHYFLRSLPWQGDIQVNLTDKKERKRQSHEIAESVRAPINRLVKDLGGHVQVVEVPPGPPVLSTLVLEVYGPDLKERRRIAADLESLLTTTAGITDIATYEAVVHPLEQLKVDKEKASLNGMAPSEIVDTVATAVKGTSVGLAHVADEPEPVEIVVRMPKPDRLDLQNVQHIALLSRFGRMVPLEMVSTKAIREQNLPVYHKNLLPVSYVLADVTDELGSPVYGMLALGKGVQKVRGPGGKPLEILYTHPPRLAESWAMKWDGEWQITYEVFRDLGISFAAVIILIFILVVGWFQSFRIPWIVMLPIPLSIIGILPAHWVFGMFFTATSMIGLIAGAGIVVRNAIILVDFIELKLTAGVSLEEAVIEAGAIRFRPMLLTAAAVFVGASVILFDPIFQGLALSLMAGEVASTLLSRTAVPVLYYVIMRKVKRQMEAIPIG
jgi:multidrug efflux pump subunit AcrB